MPGADAILEDADQLSMWYSDSRRAVMYPCNDNELLNFVLIHPEGESQGSAEGIVQFKSESNRLLTLK